MDRAVVRRWLAEHILEVMVGLVLAFCLTVGSVGLSMHADIASIKTTLASANLPDMTRDVAELKTTVRAADLPKIATDVAALQQRVEANERAVPDIWLKAAMNVTGKPYPLVLLASRPEHSGTETLAAVSLIDWSAGLVKYFELKSADGSGVGLVGAMRDLARSMGSDAVTFNGAALYWKKVQEAGIDSSVFTFPSSLDGSLSYAVATLKPVAERDDALKKFAALHRIELKQTLFDPKGMQWTLDGLGKDLEKMPQLYTHADLNPAIKPPAS